MPVCDQELFLLVQPIAVQTAKWIGPRLQNKISAKEFSSRTTKNKMGDTLANCMLE